MCAHPTELMADDRDSCGWRPTARGNTQVSYGSRGGSGAESPLASRPMMVTSLASEQPRPRIRGPECSRRIACLPEKAESRKRWRTYLLQNGEKSDPEIRRWRPAGGERIIAIPASPRDLPDDGGLEATESRLPCQTQGHVAKRQENVDKGIKGSFSGEIKGRWPQQK